MFLVKHYKREFTPIEVSREFNVTNKTIINRLSALVKNEKPGRTIAGIARTLRTSEEMDMTN